MVAARDHDSVAPDGGTESGSELGRELRGHLDVGQAGDPVPPEERPTPPLAPHEAHGQGGAVLDLLVGPDLDIGLDHAAFPDATGIRDDHALGQEGIGPHDRLAPDDRLLDHRAGPDLDSIPQDAALDVRPGVNQAVRADDRVAHPRARSDVGVTSDDDRAGQSRGIVHTGSLVEPDGVARALVPFPRDVHPDGALEQIDVRRPVLGQISHVSPVAAGHVTPEGASGSEESREQLLAEVIRPVRRDSAEDRRLEQVDAGIDGVAEHLAPRGLLEEAEDATLLVRDDDAVGERLLHPREHHGRLGALGAVEGHGGLEVEIRQHVSRHDEDRLAGLLRRESDSPGRAQVGGGGDVRHVHAPAVAIPEMRGNGLGHEIQEDDEIAEPVAFEQADRVLHDRHIAYGHERLGHVGRERSETGAKPARHDDSLHSMHSRPVPGPGIASGAAWGPSEGSPGMEKV